MTNNIPKLISVCIPSYNNAEYISDTIESVIHQTYSNIELIITDDGSSDDTFTKAKEAAEKAPFPVKIEALPSNQGIETNWNLALSLADGEYIKLLPADDTLSPDCLSLQAKALDNNSDAALTFCARTVITKTGKPVMSVRFFGDETIPSLMLVKRCVTSGTNVIGEPGAVLFRASISKAVGEFDGSSSYIIDVNYWERLLRHGNAISIKKALCTFRIDSNLSVRLGWDRPLHYFHMINTIAGQWNLSKTIILWGKLRTAANEILRRVAHFFIKLKG